jgi:hypothetical protein
MLRHGARTLHQKPPGDARDTRVYLLLPAPCVHSVRLRSGIGGGHGIQKIWPY